MLSLNRGCYIAVVAGVILLKPTGRFSSITSRREEKRNSFLDVVKKNSLWSQQKRGGRVVCDGTALVSSLDLLECVASYWLVLVLLLAPLSYLQVTASHSELCVHLKVHLFGARPEALFLFLGRVGGGVYIGEGVRSTFCLIFFLAIFFAEHTSTATLRVGVLFVGRPPAVTYLPTKGALFIVLRGNLQ